MTRREERETAWPEREARMVEYYERGEGYRKAVHEAHRLSVERNFSREAVQVAAQSVGWKMGKLLAAFVREKLEIPEAMRPWARRHIENYRRRNREA